MQTTQLTKPSIRVARLALLCAALLALAVPGLAADVAGKWDVTWDTQGGIRTGPMTLKVSGSDVTATIGPEAAKDDAITGTFRDGKLKLEGNLYAAEAGHTGTFELDGVLENGELKGGASWDGNHMTFTAKRPQ